MWGQKKDVATSRFAPKKDIATSFFTVGLVKTGCFGGTDMIYLLSDMKKNESETGAVADWSAAQYLKFEQVRTQPSRDLVARISTVPRTVLDVGCGPGNSTAAIAERFPEAQITGIDASPDMLEKARKAHPAFTFIEKSLSPDCRELEGTYDLIFSNACLQWIPDHKRLIPALWKHVNPGGTLAFQIPLTDAMPITPILEELKATSNWGRYLESVHDLGTLGQDDYFELARGLSSDFSLWRTDYAQPVAGISGLVEWYMGSRLRPFVAALPEGERAAFLAEVAARFAKMYTPLPDGTVLMWFPRLFVVVKNGG